MKCKIETSNGIMFLKGIDGDKPLEIADYIELHDSSLLMVSLILDKKEYFDWGKNHVIYTKLWEGTEKLKPTIKLKVDDGEIAVLPFIICLF